MPINPTRTIASCSSSELLQAHREKLAQELTAEIQEAWGLAEGVPLLPLDLFVQQTKTEERTWKALKRLSKFDRKE